MKKTISLLLISLVLVSCLSTSHAKGLSSVRLGMSTYEVWAAAGSPDYTIPHEDPNGRREEWIYRDKGRQVALLFEKNVLISMSW